jgi:ABC-type cobalamin transport system permease subunit
MAMQKRVLALGLTAVMSAVVLADLVLALMLASAHKSYGAVVASLTATVPGFVIAVLAWRGKLPGNCAR